MAKHILIILGHPDPRPERFCRALAEAYHAGASESGHDIAVIDVGRLDFERNILDFVGAGPIHETLLGMVEARDNGTRTRWRARLTELGRRGA